MSELVCLVDYLVSQVNVMLFFCVKYPGWVIDGYLDTMYLKIAVFVAAYGGLIATIVWLYKDIKNKGW